mgnify:FL=1
MSPKAIKNLESLFAGVWNADKVRELLPNVEICLAGIIWDATIRGRNCDYAIVFPIGTEFRYEFAWSTIANALNNRIVLKA